MEADIKSLPDIRGMYNERVFWTPTNVIGKETLTIGHVLTSFLVLAFGLFFSGIVIVLEVMLRQCEMTYIAKPTLHHSNIDSSKEAGESEEESAIEIFSHEGTMERNEEISQELENGANKEPNISKEKDSDDKVITLAEIHDELCKEESTMGNVQNEPFTVSVTSIISVDNMETDTIGPCQTVLKKSNTDNIEDKTKLNYNLSGEEPPIRYSPQWSEIIDFLDNEEYTTGHFLDGETSTTQTPIISPGLDIPTNVNSRRASSQGSAISEEDNIKSILAMIEIDETPVRGMSG